MKTWLLAAALAAAPFTAQAQDWSYFINNVSVGELDVRGDLYIRNDFGYDPNRFFGITAIILRGGGGAGGGGFVGTSGPFGTGVVGGVSGGQTFAYNSNYFGSITPTPNQLVFGNPVGTLLVNGLGLVGCSVPVLASTTAVAGYAGSTCAQAGFSGYLKLSFFFGGYSPFFPPPKLTPSDFTVSVVGVYRDVPSVFVTPEPSTFALLGAGTFVLGLVARRRRAVRFVAI